MPRSNKVGIVAFNIIREIKHAIKFNSFVIGIIVISRINEGKKNRTNNKVTWGTLSVVKRRLIFAVYKDIGTPVINTIVRRDEARPSEPEYPK
jgi:hypothetical protein